MNVCFFGSFLASYSRNKILIDGLLKNNVSIYHCTDLSNSFIYRYPKLFKKYWQIRRKIDLIFVPQVGQLDMPLAWFLSKITGKKLVFDMFFSMYETYVFDRQSVQRNSTKAFFYYWLDKFSLVVTDLIITDTYEHAKYFSSVFNIDFNKFRIIYAGADDLVYSFKRANLNKNKLIIEFHGMFTRLSGAEYFVRMAKKLENYKNIEFWLIGESKVYDEPIRVLNELKPKNLRYLKQLSYINLAKKVGQADISIGSIGPTAKTKRVISYKTYHGLASANAVITMDSPANRELLTHKKNVLFVKAGDVNDLVNKVKQMVSNHSLGENIATQGYKLFKNQLTNKILGEKLKSEFEKLISI